MHATISLHLGFFQGHQISRREKENLQRKHLAATNEALKTKSLKIKLRQVKELKIDTNSEHGKHSSLGFLEH